MEIIYFHLLLEVGLSATTDCLELRTHRCVTLKCEALDVSTTGSERLTQKDISGSAHDVLLKCQKSVTSHLYLISILTLNTFLVLTNVQSVVSEDILDNILTFAVLCVSSSVNPGINL